MLHVTITLKGKQWGDVTLAAEEVLKHLREEKYAANGGGGSLDFAFKVEGEPNDVGDEQP